MQNGRSREQVIRVLVADGTRIHTELLAGALRHNATLEIFSPPSHSTDIVETAIHHQVHVVVLASRLGEEPLGGTEALRKIRGLSPKVRGVILLDSAKPEIILGAFRAGARGVFSREASMESLSECVRRVHAGEVWATPEQIAMALDALAAYPVASAINSNGLTLLSKRELDVVSCLAEGLTNREIAARLGLSQHTIKNYLFKVFDKLGVSSRMELLFLTMNHSVANNPVHQFDESNSKKGTSFAFSHRAAEQGVPTAQMAMANMYAEGKDVKKDPSAAYMWYLVCEKNILDMKDSISMEKRRMAGLLTTEEILEAQKRALEQQKKPVQPTSPSFLRRASAIGQS